MLGDNEAKKSVFFLKGLSEVSKRFFVNPLVQIDNGELIHRESHHYYHLETNLRMQSNKLDSSRLFNLVR